MEKIALLLHESAPQAELERAVVNAVNCRFFNGKEVPAEIVAVRYHVVAEANTIVAKCWYYCSKTQLLWLAETL